MPLVVFCTLCPMRGCTWHPSSRLRYIPGLVPLPDRWGWWAAPMTGATRGPGLTSLWLKPRLVTPKGLGTPSPLAWRSCMVGGHLVARSLGGWSYYGHSCWARSARELLHCVDYRTLFILHCGIDGACASCFVWWEWGTWLLVGSTTS